MNSWALSVHMIGVNVLEVNFQDNHVDIQKWVAMFRADRYIMVHGARFKVIGILSLNVDSVIGQLVSGIVRTHIMYLAL